MGRQNLIPILTAGSDVDTFATVVLRVAKVFFGARADNRKRIAYGGSARVPIDGCVATPYDKPEIGRVGWYWTDLKACIPHW
ncbi:MAG: hypothetical protein O3B73_06255 [bacterium]|nr:hypothetical protein [bacterium]